MFAAVSFKPFAPLSIQKAAIAELPDTVLHLTAPAAILQQVEASFSFEHIPLLQAMVSGLSFKPTPP
jgi:hypothetical protein